jgi:hypothetical protein
MDPLTKPFKIPRGQLRRIIPDMGGCYATDRITVDGSKVGYMYREEPRNNIDSGWRFLAGDESQEYADAPDNWAIYEVNTICNCDEAITPYLRAPVGSAFGRVPGTDEFEPENLE